MSTLSEPTPIRLSALALMVLEDAAIAARTAPIKRTVAHRFALAWLGYAGVAKPWQIEQFWVALGKVHMPDHPQGQYCRDRDFGTFFLRWRADAGLPEKLTWWEN